MAIKRYIADADTTITNAFKSDIETRATGSNMGASDSLEVFSIYGQSVSGSAQSKTTELSRILVNFPISDIETDRTAEDIPASGSVSFYLRIYNAEHPFSVPSSFTLSASAVTADWEEGFGLDMEGYRDITKDGVGANWMNASSNSVAATATITFKLALSVGNTITIIDTAATSKTYTVASSIDTSAKEFAASTPNEARDTLALCIAATEGHNGTITTSAGAAGVINLTQATAGTSGNTTISRSGFNDVSGEIVQWSGGEGQWTRPGGDYDFNRKSTFDQTFTEGIEDLELDITSLVEQWINSDGNVLGDKSSARYGIGLFLTGTQEGIHTGTETEGRLHNPSGSVRSYYTKKFFARGSEFFFKRPIIEARWDSSKKDNRGSFYLSSSLASNEVSTLYMYNYIRGQLKDINLAGSTITVLLYSGSTNPGPESTNESLLMINSSDTAAHSIAASRISTGLYSVSFTTTASLTSSSESLYDVWKLGTKTIHTGSAITPKTFDAYNYNSNETFVTSVPNLKSIYSNAETARFRLFTRKKDWNPTIYTKAVAAAETENVEDAYYKFFRIKDDLTVVDYGTGSLNHTRLSYDVSGSYFDFDMSQFQADYMYGLKLIYYLNGKYVEQPEVFRFRVEKDLTDIE